MKNLLIGLTMLVGASILVSACGIKHDLYIEEPQAPQAQQSEQS